MKVIHFRSNSLDVERRVYQYMSGLSNGRAPVTTLLNGPTSPQLNSNVQIDIGQQATLLVLQRIYQELKVTRIPAYAFIVIICCRIERSVSSMLFRCSKLKHFLKLKLNLRMLSLT